MKMTEQVIEKIESKPLFRLFLHRIGFKNYEEYMELFWDNWKKRKTAAERFLETYQHKNERITNDTKCA